MGHQHLQYPPKTKEWLEVVALISGGADMRSVAAASSRAAEKSMIDAADDPSVRQAFFLLTQLPLAAHADDFVGELRKLGLGVSDQPALVEIGSATMDAIDLFTSRLGGRTDYGEIAQVSAVESLHAIASRELPDLFGNDQVRVRTVLAALSDPRQFAVLARDFFFCLTRRHLNYYLSRALADHVGLGKRFPSLRDREAFEGALDLHCRESASIIRNFAEQWYGKHLGQGDFSRDLAGRFVAICARKIRDELGRREPAYA